jgi:hypothetical protein
MKRFDVSEFYCEVKTKWFILHNRNTEVSSALAKNPGRTLRIRPTLSAKARPRPQSAWRALVNAQMRGEVGQRPHGCQAGAFISIFLHLRASFLSISASFVPFLTGCDVVYDARTLSREYGRPGRRLNLFSPNGSRLLPFPNHWR